MDRAHESTFLRLGQFIDLERRWAGAGDRAELAHRICATLEILLDTPNVAIGTIEDDAPYRVLASIGEWQLEELKRTSLAAKAVDTGLAQIKSLGDRSTGAFPFRVDGARGCLHVRVERPLFEGSEISFLRFVASLAGMALAARPAGEMPAAPLPAAATKSEASTASPSEDRRYVAMAAHDLRGPLSVLTGYAELLADRAGETEDEQSREFAEAVLRQAETLATAVDDLVELGRTPSGELRIEVTSFDVREMFDELRERCFTGRSTEIEWPGAEAGFSATTDRRKTVSIAQNLIDNAIKHGAENVVVRATRRDKHLIVEVSDDGPGISDDLRDGLIATAAGEDAALVSTGLGLLAIGTWTRALGGTLRITTNEPTGTVITVSLPDRGEEKRPRSVGH